MANFISIICATPAPQTIAYSFAASGTGANWDPTKYYAVHVVASYDPDDENIWLMGVQNYGWPHTGTGGAPDRETEVLQAGVSPANANDSLVVTWTAPPGPPPHHYNVFIQGPNAADDKYQIDEYGDPMSDWAGSSEVTNDTLTFTILDPTDIQGSLVTSVIIDTAGTDYVTIEGNHLLQFGDAVSVVADAAGANITTTVDYCYLIYTPHGLMTKIYVDDTLTGVEEGELLTYRDMRHTFKYNINTSYKTDYRWSNLGVNYITGASHSSAVYLNPVIQLSPSIRNRMIRDYQGYLVNRARVLNAPVEYLDVSVCGISCTYAEWRLLMEYLRIGARLILSDLQGATVAAEDGPPCTSYLCRLIDTDYVGSIGKNSRNRYTLRFEIEEQKAMIGVA